MLRGVVRVGRGGAGPGGSEGVNTQSVVLFFFQAEDGIRDYKVTGVQTCALPIWKQPGAGIEVIQVITVDALDPQPVGGCRPGIAHADSRGSHRSTVLVSRPLKQIGRASCRERV